MNPVIGIISAYLFVGVSLASFIAAFAIAKGNTRMNRTFTILSALVGIFLFGYLLELNSSTLPQMQFWNQVQYVGLPFYPAFWLLLSMTYTERQPGKEGRLKRSLVFIVPFLTFFIRLTNSWHHLYYRSMTLEMEAGFPVMLLEKGPWYYFNWIYLGACLLYATYLYINSRTNAKGRKTGQYLMLASSLIPYLGLTLIIVNPGQSGLDYAALTMPISLLLVTIALFKYDFLDVQTLARDVVFEKGKDALILIDAQHVIKDSNQLARTIFPELQINGSGYRIEDVLAHRHHLLASLGNLDQEGNNIQINIHERYYEAQLTQLVGAAGYQTGTLISLSDITEKRRIQEKLKILAARDGLTGLNNRSSFIELSEQALKLAQQTEQPCSLFMFDIDHFKNINDTYGHAAGDQVLKAMSEKMRSHFRQSDISGRIGGEEFAIFLPGTSLSHSEKAVDRFRQELAKTPIVFEDHVMALTVSIGGAEMTEQTQTLDELLHAADKALYEAKKSGRNRLVLQTSR